VEGASRGQHRIYGTLPFFATFLAGAAFTAFFAALIAAQRFFCASAIRLRAAALIPRFLTGEAAFFATFAVAMRESSVRAS
jgi:hypothetical protein